MIPAMLTDTPPISHGDAFAFKIGIVNISVNNGQRNRISTSVTTASSLSTILMDT